MAIANEPLNVVPGGQIIADGAMSGNLTSKICDIQRTSICGVQLYSASADHVGTITIEESIDGDNWVAVTFADGTTSIAAASSAALSELINLAGLGGRWLRVSYARTSGSGTLQAWAFPKSAL